MGDQNNLEGVDLEVVNRLNTAYRKVLVVGKEVFVPPIFSKRGRPFQFHVKQLRLLHFLGESNNNLSKACELAGVSKNFATRFLKSNEYREFAVECIQDQAVQDGWTARRVVVEIDRIYQGEKKPSEEQMDALKMMKDIVYPKKGGGEGSAGGVTVNLNFPVLPPGVQKELKDLADKAASIDVEAA